MSDTIIPKELTVYKKEVAEIKTQASSLVINSQEDMNKSADLLHRIKKAKDTITTRKEEITRPLMTALASARDLFKPLELGFQEAEKQVKAIQLAFLVEEEARVEKEKEKIAKRVEKGTMRADTAVGKLEDLGDSPKAGSGEVGRASMRTVRKVRIVDETAIPREYLVCDMVKITKALLQENAVIPGTEIFEEKQMVAR